jgi:hypothetical protein
MGQLHDRTAQDLVLRECRPAPCFPIGQGIDASVMPVMTISPRTWHKTVRPMRNPGVRYLLSRRNRSVSSIGGPNWAIENVLLYARHFCTFAFIQHLPYKDEPVCFGVAVLSALAISSCALRSVRREKAC